MRREALSHFRVAGFTPTILDSSHMSLPRVGCQTLFWKRGARPRHAQEAIDAFKRALTAWSGLYTRAMAPLMAMPAQLMAKLADPAADGKLKILDIAAGHGLFGIGFATNNQQAEIVALDWPKVLEVAQENASKAGVADRYSTIAGSAFDVDYGTGHDLVLLTNFLHHFDPPTCETLLGKVHASLAEGGRAVTLEFVPDEDRISPPDAAAFSVMMLGSTPSGDAYTFSDLERMFANAGFASSEFHELPPTIQRVVISQK